MDKKVVALSCIAWALAAVLTASPAHAVIAVWEADLEPGNANSSWVVVSPHHESIYTQICGYNLYFEQHMRIGDGPFISVFSESLYSPGRKQLWASGMSCEGFAIYFLGT